jgi:hypothetical protein
MSRHYETAAEVAEGLRELGDDPVLNCYWKKAFAEHFLAAQSEADDQSEPYIDRDIRPMRDAHVEGVVSCDPGEIVSGGTGFTLIDGDGERLRDLVGVPTGCVQLGEQMEEAATPDKDS